MSSSKTKIFFENSKTNYIDSTIAIGENKIHYLETGNKEHPTLYFIHGSPGSWDAYKDYLKDSLLLKKYRMIALDRPGFGYSDFRKSKNLYEQANIIEQFIEKTKNGKSIYLIGHSYGGPAIVKMAIDKPFAYKELIIVAGALDPDAETPEKWRPYFMSNPLKLIVPGAMLPANDELWWLKNDLKNLKSNLNKVTAHVLVIHGTIDNLVPYSNVAFIEREFINATSIEVLSIKDADHFIPWSHFQIIRDKLLTLKE